MISKLKYAFSSTDTFIQVAWLYDTLIAQHNQIENKTPHHYDRLLQLLQTNATLK